MTDQFCPSRKQVKDALDVLLPKVRQSLDRNGEDEVFQRLVNGVLFCALTVTTGVQVNAEIQAEALIRLAKLATPTSSPATTLAE
jgi:hypothetical protein